MFFDRLSVSKRADDQKVALRADIAYRPLSARAAHWSSQLIVRTTFDNKPHHAKYATNFRFNH